ncbi:MAG TPA: lipid A deacylase LpxR family protein [Verrucomicrobiae bacterium]|nr:lipid A deacylase LpxR family protein [Verrucomicrobiae bacterium]
MVRQRFFAFFCYGLATVLPLMSCRAENRTPVVGSSTTNEDRQGPFFAVTEENDLFSNPFTATDHTDRHYTQGLKFTWLNGDDDMPQWVRRVSDDVPKLGINMTAQNLGYVFGENMYTPQNLQESALITNDRPYAGWLYGGVYLQRRGEVGDSGVPVQESFEIDFGTTGPDSLAGWAQTHFHQAFDSADVPQGWHNQLAGEPGLLLKYERFWRWSPNAETARYVDLIPHAGGELGNIMIFQNLGGVVRVGYNLPEDFGVQTIDSPASLGGGTTSNSPPFACYVFGGVDGRAVEHNLFLDGNSFRSGPSVERIPWVADLSTGGAVRMFRHLEISYTRVVRTHEFVGQQHPDQFGSLEAKAMFMF